MAIRARLRRLERLAPTRRKNPDKVSLEDNVAELRRIEKWLAARGFESAEAALKNGARFESRWGTLRDIAEIERNGERLLLEEKAAILGTVTRPGPGIVERHFFPKSQHFRLGAARRPVSWAKDRSTRCSAPESKLDARARESFPIKLLLDHRSVNLRLESPTPGLQRNIRVGHFSLLGATCSKAPSIVTRIG